MNQEAQNHRRCDLITALVPRARMIARQMARRFGRLEELDELVGAALEGLTEAGARYDPERGVIFPTFARHRVQGAIVDAMRAHDFVPRSVRCRARAIEHANRAFAAIHGRFPCEAELAVVLGLTVDAARRLTARAHLHPMIPLSDLHEDGPHQNATGEAHPDLTDTLVHAQEGDALREALTRLPERERMAIAMFYLEEHSLKVIGAALGVSVSRVSQLCARGIERLRGDGRLQRINAEFQMGDGDGWRRNNEARNPR